MIIGLNERKNETHEEHQSYLQKSQLMTVYHFLGNPWATAELLAKSSTGRGDAEVGAIATTLLRPMVRVCSATVFADDVFTFTALRRRAIGIELTLK